MEELTEQQSNDPSPTEPQSQADLQPSVQHTESHQTVQQSVAPQPPRHQPESWRWPAWTGFSGYTSPPHSKNTDFQRSKTLWDWLQLLFIPVILAAGALWFNSHQEQVNSQASKNQYMNDVHIAATRYANDQQLAQDQQQEATLKSYLDDMSDLLLNHNLRNSKPGDGVRQVARERTLTTLRRLKADRNEIVLQFLRETNLIGKQNAVIDLSGADLSNDDLRRVSLYSLNLIGAILIGATLDGAYLSSADLNKATLDGAHLNYADLSKATLSFAYLRYADLSKVGLIGATLFGAILIGATLDGAYLSSADLSGADLNKTTLSGADLGGATLIGATLDGAKLDGADLQGARYNTKTIQVKNPLGGYLTLGPTQWPHGFDPVRAGLICVNC